MEYFRDGLMLKVARGGVDLSDEETILVEKVFQEINQEDLISILKNMAEGFDNIRTSQQPRVMAEMILLRLCDRRPYVGLEDILKKLQRLEGSLSEQSASMEYSAPPTIPACPDNVVPKKVAQPIPESPPSEDIPQQTKHGNSEEPFDTKALYQKLIQGVGSVKKSLAALLPHGEIVGYEKDKVVLGFEKGFQSMVDKPESVSILQKELENILHRPVRVAFSKDSLKRSKDSGNEKPALKKDEIEAVESNPAYKTITEMFDAKLVHIQKVIS